MGSVLMKIPGNMIAWNLLYNMRLYMINIVFKGSGQKNRKNRIGLLTIHDT